MSHAASVSSTPQSCQVPLAQIQIDPGSQARVKVDDGVVGHYAEAMARQREEGGLRFPAIVLFSDGKSYWVGDGFHRVLAAQKVPLTEFLAEVHSGNQRDALLYSISANSTHGLQRSNADKRRAVELLLADAEWQQWGDREIARRCQVSHPLVRQLRRSASGRISRCADASGTGSHATRRKVRRGGTVYELTPPSVEPVAKPHADEQPVVDPATGNQAPTEQAPPLPPRPSAQPTTDQLGIPLPKDRTEVFAVLPDFQEARDLVARLAKLVDRIARSPGGEVYRQDLIQKIEAGQPVFSCPGLRLFLGKLQAAQPYCCYCPHCQAAHPGRADSRCRTCSGRGWATRAAYEACPTDRQQQLLTGFQAPGERKAAG